VTYCSPCTRRRMPCVCGMLTLVNAYGVKHTPRHSCRSQLIHSTHFVVHVSTESNCSVNNHSSNPRTQCATCRRSKRVDCADIERHCITCVRPITSHCPYECGRHAEHNVTQCYIRFDRVSAACACTVGTTYGYTVYCRHQLQQRRTLRWAHQQRVYVAVVHN
jgi:hypothetical protein